MKDGVEDKSIEPNTAYHMRDYIKGDMWDSPDLWNRAEQVPNFSTASKTHQGLEQNSTANKARVSAL